MKILLLLLLGMMLMGCISVSSLPDDEETLLANELKLITDQKSKPPEPTPVLPEDELSFIWPVKGPLTGAATDRGINIKASEGTPVRAVKSGIVKAVSEKMRGYGKVILIEHYKNSFSSFYGYNSEILVKEGEIVKQGQVIARVGKTGRAAEPQLMFRLYKNGNAVNPLNYLP